MKEQLKLLVKLVFTSCLLLSYDGFSSIVEKYDPDRPIEYEEPTSGYTLPEHYPYIIGDMPYIGLPYDIDIPSRVKKVNFIPAIP